MEQQRLSTLFSAYINNTLNAAEKKEFMDFINRQQTMDAFDIQIERLWTESAHTAVADAESELRIQNVIRQIKPRKHRFLQILPYATAACLAIALGFVYFFSNLNLIQREQAEIQSHTVSSLYGQRKTVTLNDGTSVTLSAGSSITYSDDYNKTKRTISFKGEAFFEVAKNPAKPFIVQYAGLYTKVLGTSFNIRAYDNDKNIDVTVATGRVEVGKISNKANPKKTLAILKPGQQMAYTKTSGLTLVNNAVNVKQMTAWKEDILILSGERFDEVAVKLERWYNVKINFEHPGLKNCRFKGTFKNMPITAVLNLLKKSAGFTYTIKSNYITIKGKGCL